MASIKDMLDDALAPFVIHRPPVAPPEAWTPETAPFVVDAKSLADNRRFKQPDVTRVGPVRSGSLREFEEPKP